MQHLRDGVRTIVTFGVMLPGTMVYAAIVWMVASRRPESPRVDALVRSWGRACLRFAGARLEVVGLEHVDTSRSYVVVSNHLSGFDIMAHFAAFPIPIRFLAKSELFRIPFFGNAMRAIGIVEVDRGAGRSIHEHINTTAKDAVSKGRSLIIYPEGTRPRDGVMQSFKKGAFTIANGMGLPVLPTAITGSRHVWKPGTKLIRSGTITITILPPIEAEDLDSRGVEGLRDDVHAKIEAIVTGGTR